MILESLYKTALALGLHGIVLLLFIICGTTYLLSVCITLLRERLKVFSQSSLPSQQPQSFRTSQPSQQPQSFRPSQPPVNEAHIAWLSAYENRVKWTEEACKKSASENRLKMTEEMLKKFARPQGWIYAYTFAACQREDRPYPIKVGQTRQSVEKRVHDQCKGTAVFERPVILGKWRSFAPRRDERAIHQELRRMGCIDTDGHGTEWFHATPQDVEQAVSKILGS